MMPETGRVFPRLFTFRVRLEGQKSFFPASTYALTEEQAKEQIRGRFPGPIAEWKPGKAHKSLSLYQTVGQLPQYR